MGKFDFQMPGEFEEMLRTLENYDELAKELILACEPMVIEAVKSEAAAHVETAAMVNSVKSTGIKKNQYGYYDIVRPTGKSSKFKVDKKSRRKVPIRNMEKMAWQEYGYTKRNGQKVSPQKILTKAIERVYPRCMEKMQEEFDKKAGK